MHTRSSDGDRRIGRNPSTAHIVRAIVAIERKIHIECRGDDGARTIALILLAITSRLRRDRRSICSKAESARIRRTSARLAFRIHPWALRGVVALHAHRHAITEGPAILITRRVDGRRRIRGNAHRTHVVRALITIHRQIRIQRHTHDATSSVALILQTIAIGLRHDGRTASRKVEPARIGGAGLGLAFRVDACALRSSVAFDTRARAVAERASILRASGIDCQWRKRGNPRNTGVARALNVVVGKVSVISNGDDRACAVTLIHLAVSSRLRRDDRS